jgi:hypothetical protein
MTFIEVALLAAFRTAVDLVTTVGTFERCCARTGNINATRDALPGAFLLTIAHVAPFRVAVFNLCQVGLPAFRPAAYPFETGVLALSVS